MSDAVLRVAARRVTMAIRAPAVQRMTVAAPAPVRLTVKPRTTVAIAVPRQGPPGPAGRDGASPHSYPVTVTAAGQTVFGLSAPPRTPTDVALFVNGVAYRAPAIVLTAVLLTWAGPFDLSPDDAVFAVYA